MSSILPSDDQSSETPGDEVSAKIDPPNVVGPSDYRLYIPHNDGWTGRVKADSTREYCYMKNPGEDYHHLIVSGEIFLQRDHEKVCLNCAMRSGIACDNRLHWQYPKPRKPMPL